MSNFIDIIQLARQEEFMRIGGQLDKPEKEIKTLYLKLIAEELGELDEALNKKFFTIKELAESQFRPSVEELDALADILVVAAGFYSTNTQIPVILLEEDSILEICVNNNDKQVLLFDNLMSLQSMALALLSAVKNTDVDYNDWQDAIPAMILSVVMVMKIYDLDIPAVMKEVYDSNFSKFTSNSETGELEAVRNEHGKIMKGKDFKLPNFEQFIHQGANVNDEH